MSAEFSRDAIQEVMDSAKRLNVELNEAEAVEWLEAMRKAKESNDDIAYCERTGVFGQNIAMLDFSTERLEYFRKIGALIEFYDEPGRVETALALSGSSAQSKIQRFPGDADFFERVNIIADTREEACQILAEIMREKALSTVQGPTYQLIEVKLGSYPVEFVKSKRTFAFDSPIAWDPDEIAAGKKVGFTPDGQPFEIIWEESAQDPGWCKLDWVVADPMRGTLANASNMLDVT